MRALLVIMLLASPALADREDCAKKTGRWTTDETGTGCLVGGKQDGVWEKRSSTGQLLMRIKYTMGEPDGPAVSFHATCQIEERGHYVAGKRDGAWAQWLDDGQRVNEGTYKNDLREGVWKFYF